MRPRHDGLQMCLECRIGRAASGAIRDSKGQIQITTRRAVAKGFGSCDTLRVEKCGRNAHRCSTIRETIRRSCPEKPGCTHCKLPDHGETRQAHLECPQPLPESMCSRNPTSGESDSETDGMAHDLELDGILACLRNLRSHTDGGATRTSRSSAQSPSRQVPVLQA